MPRNLEEVIAQALEKKKGNRAPEFCYEDRLVAFIDILGFKHAVDRTTRDTAYLQTLLRAIDTLRDTEHQVKDENDFRLTHFSDSIVLSYRLTGRSSVFHLLIDLLLRIVEVTGQGILLRGGIAVGQLLHTDDHVVGPAMNAAYLLESTIAKGPRVIVDKAGRRALIEAANKHPAFHHNGPDEARYTKSMLTRDDDGIYFLDYISSKGAVEVAGLEPEAYPDYIAEIGRMIEVGLQSDDAGVLSKYLWLHRRYAAELNRIRSLPPYNSWRQDNPDAYAFYCSLKTHSGAAAKAQAAIDQSSS